MDKKILTEEELSSSIAVVVGTRPGIVMFAPIIHELRARKLDFFVIHTGQHYSPNMDAQFFDDLKLPQPDHRLEGVAENTTHGSQTAAMLSGIEKILMQRRPCIILVGGDANTNLAGALAARKLRINVAHVEAGERSYDRSMPEEHNRVMIDHISDFLFVTSNNSVANLQKEGITEGVFNTGNPIVDASIQHFDLAMENSTVVSDHNLERNNYALLTTHREENVDSHDRLKGALEGVSRASVESGLEVIFCVHPRTRKRLSEFQLQDWAEKLEGIRMIEAVGYLDFLCLVGNARLVFTDSGGVQQEACIHKVPCITLRDNTEWTDTISIGANQLSGCDPDTIVNCSREALASSREWEAPFGDGHSAANIADIVEKYLADYSA